MKYTSTPPPHVTAVPTSHATTEALEAVSAALAGLAHQLGTLQEELLRLPQVSRTDASVELVLASRELIELMHVRAWATSATGRPSPSQTHP